jgi:hypothetical protein
MSQRSAGDAFAASHAAVVGRYAYRPKTDEWTWSDAMYVMHGFEPGSVVPSTELVMRHIHPADRPAAWESRDGAVDRGQPFTFLHRIVRADNQERVVIAAGHLDEEADGTPVIIGHLIDLTDMRRDAVAAAVDPAVMDFSENRAAIEQSKGVLMQLYSVEADDAFALLRAFSMDAHLKVRDVATLLISAASANVTPAKRRGPSAHDLLEALHAGRPPEQDDDGQAGRGATLP